MARLSLAERIRYLHDTENFFDVEFILNHNGQTEKVKGHKLIFASSSEAFEVMFYGDLAKGDTVEIEDVEPQAFKTLKKFVYTDIGDFQSVSHAKQVYKVADKYGLLQLSKMAEAYMSANLSSATALRILEFSRGCEKLEMEEQCLNVIREETAGVLNGDDFLCCDLQFVDLIVSDDKLNIKEIELFNSVEKWAESNFNTNDTSCDGDDAQLFKQVLKKIRFLSMTPEEFTLGPGHSSLLKVEEKFSLLTNLITPGAMALPDGFCTDMSSRQTAFISSVDFTSSEDGRVTKINWRIRGMSTLPLDTPHCSPLFNINNHPFTVYIKPFMDQRNKSTYFHFKCHQDVLNCQIKFTRKFLLKEEAPVRFSDSRKFSRTEREVKISARWHWHEFASHQCLSDDDCLNLEVDFEMVSKNE